MAFHSIVVIILHELHSIVVIILHELHSIVVIILHELHVNYSAWATFKLIVFIDIKLCVN